MNFLWLHDEKKMYENATMKKTMCGFKFFVPISAHIFILFLYISLYS